MRRAVSSTGPLRRMVAARHRSHGGESRGPELLIRAIEVCPGCDSGLCIDVSKPVAKRKWKENRDHGSGHETFCRSDAPAYHARERYDRDMQREVVRLTSTEAIRDIANILERVEQGAEVIVEKDQRPVAIIQPAPSPGRLLSECIALADAHGSKVTLDEDFGKDLEEIIQSHREPLDASRWD